VFIRQEPTKTYQFLLESELERAITRLKSKLDDPEEYAKWLANVERLYRLLDKKEQSRSVSKDTLATVGANLLGIFMILKHERVNVITSKALNFVIRPK
jgi:hypothetical protein